MSDWGFTCQHCNQPIYVYNETIVQCTCPESVQADIEDRAIRQNWLKTFQEEKDKQLLERRKRYRKNK